MLALCGATFRAHAQNDYLLTRAFPSFIYPCISFIPRLPSTKICFPRSSSCELSTAQIYQECSPASSCFVSFLHCPPLHHPGICISAFPHLSSFLRSQRQGFPKKVRCWSNIKAIRAAICPRTNPPVTYRQNGSNHQLGPLEPLAGTLKPSSPNGSGATIHRANDHSARSERMSFRAWVHGDGTSIHPPRCRVPHPQSHRPVDLRRTDPVSRSHDAVTA